MSSSESGVLHLVLTYLSHSHTLVAELYNSDNIPNSKSSNPYLVNASYTLLKNNVFEEIYVDMGDKIEIPVEYLLCGDEYKIFVEYTADGIAYPYSVAKLIIDSSYVFGSYIVQNIISNKKISLRIVPPFEVTPANIQWAYNYELIKQNGEELIVCENGIYEVAFRCSKTCMAYYSILEVTDAQPAMYIRIIGNDDNLYGTMGIPKSILEIKFVPVNFNSALINSIYVGKSFVVNDTKYSLSKMTPSTLIHFYTYSICGIGLVANTFVLPSRTIKKTSDGHSPIHHPFGNSCSHIKYPRPSNGRPLPLPKTYGVYNCV